MMSSTPEIRVVKEGSGEYKILASSFIAVIGALQNAEEFKEIYDLYCKKHFKSAHIPYAFVVDEYKKCSDDGEPSGTAGRPLLGLIENANLNKCYVMVARYFGGTKLGTPRLRRSFLESATEALNSAVLAEVSKKDAIEATLDYSSYESLKKQVSKKGLTLLDEKYDTDVTLTICGGKIIESLDELGISPITIKELGEIEFLKEISK